MGLTVQGVSKEGNKASCLLFPTKAPELGDAGGNELICLRCSKSRGRGWVLLRDGSKVKTRHTFFLSIPRKVGQERSERRTVIAASTGIKENSSIHL